MTKNDTSMERLADVTLQSVAKYQTDDGTEVEIRKARTSDYPLVLKVIRSVASYIDGKTGGAVSGGDPESAKKQAEAAFSEVDQLFTLVEDNMPLVLTIIENLSSLDREGVENLSLEDLVALGTLVWQVNQGFFMQAMAIISGLTKSTPQAPGKAAPRKRARRS